MVTKPNVVLPRDGARRLRVSLRREKLTLAMQMATVFHRSRHKECRANASTQTVTYAAPAPVDEYVTPRPAATATPALGSSMWHPHP